MDWSLVLASQGIEHVIDHAEQAGWSLLVSASDHAAALAGIRQYRVESRRWPWQRMIPQTGEVFDWVAVAWVLLTIVFYWLSDQRAAIEDVGIVDGAAVASGQWWRLFTATLLHADLAHLASNAVFGFLLLGLAMGRHGTGVGLLAAFLAGVGGNLVSWLAHGQGFHGLGASGVVMGALGLITVQSFDPARRHSQTLRILLGGFAAGVMLFVLLGLSPETDVVAHFGGFVAGIAIGLLLSAGARIVRGPSANLAAGLIFALLVLGNWWLALRHLG
jgi:membrane associated rhomboid family serine protease